jgi:hypothetical protein
LPPNKQIVVSLITILGYSILGYSILGCSCRTAPEPFSYERQIGVVAEKAGRGCLEIHDASMPPNAEIRLVSTKPPQTVANTHVGARDAACSDGGELQGYEVSPPATGHIPVIGVVNYHGQFRKEGDLVSADLDGDGVPEYFRSCLSQEGVHFTVWTGKPLTGKLRWHQYHYLGYDIEPDCKPEETGK